MSNASSEASAAKPKPAAGKPSQGQVPWNPWIGVAFTVFLFIGAQFVAGLLLLIYPLIAGWSGTQATDWLSDSLEAKIAYLALTTVLILVPIYFYLKRYKVSFVSIGLRRPKWSDPLWSLAALPAYILSFAIIVALIKFFVPALDINQAQDLGFNDNYNAIQLIFIAIALVVLPPITEEIIFRGLLYGSLKKAMPIILAAIVTSILFASGHLLESGDNSLLYIAGIDTFVLSLILVYLREITGGLWASIGLHAIKNCIAFVSLFLLHAR